MACFTIFAVLSLIVRISTPLQILLPLYEYPGTSAAAWANATAAIAAYPGVNWQVIINPNSGPGTTGTSPSDPNYITGISKLNSYANVITLGYVDTAYYTRAYSAVVGDVAVYASWANYKKANISIGGIFFDDVVTASPTPSSDTLKYYHNISTYAYANVPSDVTPVVFNPGGLGPTQLFSWCDTMVEFESPLSSYQNVTTIKTFPAGDVGQSAVIIYNATAATDVKSLVHAMAKNGVGSVYFDYGACFYQNQPTGCYNQLSLVALKGLAAAVLAG